MCWLLKVGTRLLPRCARQNLSFLEIETANIVKVACATGAPSSQGPSFYTDPLVRRNNTTQNECSTTFDDPTQLESTVVMANQDMEVPAKQHNRHRMQYYF